MREPYQRPRRRREPADAILIGLITALACVLGATIGYALGELLRYMATL